MPRPNIVFLMSDHTNAQAVAPDSQCLTPNLDALAQDGLRFRRCTTTNAICSPARASLMTSTYASTHGMWDCTHTQRQEWVNVSDRLTYWSQRLADAGYLNAYFGKWHVEQTKKLENFGWQEYDIGIGSARGEPTQGSELVVEKDGYRPYLMAGFSDDAPEHHPAYEQGIDFIRAAAGGDRPFCCFISAAEPHDPYVPPRRFMEMYDVEGIRPSPTLHEEGTDKPEVVARMRRVWQDLTEADWRRISAAYWAVITFLDSEVGRVLDTLRQCGMYDETIVVVTADHGDMLGGHGLATKGVGTAYEEVYNIPLILRVPGAAAGEDDTHRVSLVDIGPTVMDLLDLEPPEPCHGRSMLPILRGDSRPEEWQDAYGEFFGQRFVYTQRIVWHGDWKYIFSPGGVDELYNLADDPHEEHNVASDPAHRDRLESMCRRMWRKMREIGDGSLFNTHYATLRTASVGPWSVRDEE